MQPLKINAKCVAGPEDRLEHIRYALSLNLEELGVSKAHNKVAVLVGSGPSVKKEVETIRQLKEGGCFIVAIKGGHDFLIENGIIPHAAVCVDPLPDQAKYFQKKFDGENAPVYLISSQCHKAIFDFLEDQRIVLWHTMTASSEELLEGKVKVGGGSTSGTRGLVLTYMMGFRHFHLFGYDSCLQDGLRKIDGERWGDSDDEPTLELFAADKVFYADPAMAAQANEIQEIVEFLEGAHLKAHGEGLIQTIFENNAKQQLGGYYAVGDEFVGRPVPPIRQGTARRIKETTAGKRLGVYRGPDYFPERNDKAAA